MSTSPGEVHGFVVHGIDHHPIRLDMTVSKTPPVAGQRTVSMASLETMTQTNDLDDRPERFQVNPALAKSLQVSLERAA